MEKESEHKEEILELVKKASSEDYETQWNDQGIPQVKKKSEIEKGKKSRRAGGDFELKVRKDLESKGWTVAKWPNNIDLETKKVIPAKRKFNPFSKAMTLGTGFPDFIAFQLVGERTYNVIGVESKLNGTLSREEKEKCAFLLQNKIFNEIWISEKDEESRGKIKYLNFKDKFGDKFL